MTPTAAPTAQPNATETPSRAAAQGGHAPGVNPPGAAASTSMDIAVRAVDLGKRFKIYARPHDRIAEWVTGGRVKRHEDFWAVRGVSFEVPRGECLGIIGPNGSGKSTLLKMVTGALQPTEGTFEVRGRVLSLIELGTGMNPLMTGRENVNTAASLLAFPPGYAQERMAEIEAFAEIGEFFDRPFQLYSSGMKVRLAFAMFACFKPELFIVDEALSVGDVFFQQKCVKLLDRLLADGMTMLFVSHDVSSVQRLSKRVIVMNHGREVFAGPPEEAVSRYFAIMGAEGRAPKPPPRRAITSGAVAPGGTPLPPEAAAAFARHNVLPRAKGRHGTGEMSVEAATFRNEEGSHVFVIESLRTATVTLLLRANEDVAHPQCGIHIYDRLANLVFAAGTRQMGVAIPAMKAGEQRIVTFRVTMAVQPEQYTFSVGCGEPSDTGPDAGVIHDRHEGLGPIVVTHEIGRPRPFYGAAQLPMEVIL